MLTGDDRLRNSSSSNICRPTNRDHATKGLRSARRAIQCPIILSAILVFAASKHTGVLYGDDGAKVTKANTAAQAAFLEAYKVFTHPRCVNCHPAGHSPLRGDNNEPHSYLRRGVDGNGVYAVRCTNCHQSQNLPGEHSPPGACHPTKEEGKQNEPRWRMPPSATPMVFEKRTPAQLCRQLLNRKQNGNLTPKELLEHVTHDPLVLWGWNPGEGRSTPPLSHKEFVRNVKEWVDKGAACPR